MKTVLVCSNTTTMRERLLEDLSHGFVVQAVHTHNDVLEYIKETAIDIIIAEARRDHFADFLRRIIEMRPNTSVHLFRDNWVFCHYPLKRPAHALMQAINAAGISYPSGLIRPTPAAPAPRAGQDHFVINA